MKMGELRCFLSEYQNLVNEQIFVFREITVFSLGTFPDVASETRFIRLGRIMHEKSPSVYARSMHTNAAY